jgi:flavin reductase (DIM6/NTAB) family NADH-FMN oxidoreductase RutF
MSEIPNKEQIGKSLGRVASGVGILTVLHKDQPGAMLVSWFQQASFDPPMITVAIKSGRSVSELLKASGKFVLNVLHTGQKNILAHFGKGFEPGQNPFKGIPVHKKQTGIPILKEALCFLECELRNVFPAGDHHIYVGEIINGGSEEEGSPMVHIRRTGFNY